VISQKADPKPASVPPFHVVSFFHRLLFSEDRYHRGNKAKPTTPNYHEVLHPCRCHRVLRRGLRGRLRRPHVEAQLRRPGASFVEAERSPLADEFDDNDYLSSRRRRRRLCRRPVEVLLIDLLL